MNEAKTEALDAANAHLTNAGLPPVPVHPYLSLTRDNRVVILRTTAETWAARCASAPLRKGTQARARQLEAFLQGALAVLTCARVMNHDEAQRIAFMVAVDRGEEVVAGWAADRTDAEAAEDVRARADGLAAEQRDR